MKWNGIIGYREFVKTEPGVWEEKIIEKTYKGDLIKIRTSLQSGNQVNDDIRIKNIISIVADPYASLNMDNMLYVKVSGIKWKVSDIDVAYPRLQLTLGGKYNEG